MKQHFAHQHPTFGTSNKPKGPAQWSKSVYYWWWQYLRRSESYLKTCAVDGQGKCANLYADFGDVRRDDFKAWWQKSDRGARLFAEPPTHSIRVLDEAVVLKARAKESLVLDVPLNLPMSHLRKAFNAILRKHHTGKRGVRHNAKSRALYAVEGKPNLEFLETALLAWDEQVRNPQKQLWRIAQDAKIVTGKHWVKENDPGKIAAGKKNVLAATASRYLKKAKRLIANAERGRFPDTRSMQSALI